MMNIKNDDSDDIVTITEGTNRLVEPTRKDILKEYRDIRHNRDAITHCIPRFWDGRAAERIASVIAGNANTSEEV